MALKYSQAQYIAAIRDYYEFLAAMFVDPSFIIDPLPSGWLCLNPPHLHNLRKIDAMLELMQNLPYIVKQPYTARPQILPG